jgi:hypothetical protein
MISPYSGCVITSWSSGRLATATAGKCFMRIDRHGNWRSVIPKEQPQFRTSEQFRYRLKAQSNATKTGGRRRNPFKSQINYTRRFILPLRPATGRLPYWHCSERVLFASRLSSGTPAYFRNIPNAPLPFLPALSGLTTSSVAN